MRSKRGDEGEGNTGSSHGSKEENCLARSNS